MFKILIEKKKHIQILSAVILLILWTLTMILGSSEDKVAVLVLSLLLPFVVYGFVRLMFRIIAINAPLKIQKGFLFFFLLFGFLGYLMMISHFFIELPNGLTPTFSCTVGLIIASLDEAKRLLEEESKE